MGELWFAGIGQTHLEMTGDPMSEMTKEAGAALDLLQDLIARDTKRWKEVAAAANIKLE